MKIDFLSLVFGIVLGTLASTWYGYYIKRPKLAIQGSSSGGGKDFYSNSISVSNVPGLIGIRFGDTVFFGWTIIAGREFGEVIDRSPAHQCYALLLDKQSNEHICRLWWRDVDRKFRQEVTINSGQSAELFLFARRADELLKYFPYQVQDIDSTSPVVPADHLKFDSTREFIIEIVYSYGKKRFRREGKMTKGFNGRLQWTLDQSGGGSF